MVAILKDCGHFIVFFGGVIMQGPILNGRHKTSAMRKDQHCGCIGCTLIILSDKKNRVSEQFRRVKSYPRRKCPEHPFPQAKRVMPGQRQVLLRERRHNRH